MQSSPIALVILDGYGYSPESKYNAIAQAKKPIIDYLMTHYPHTLLDASGKAVGLPEGYIGNSEVGHLTIGAGRIIPFPFLQLHEQIASGSFFSNPLLTANLETLAETGQTLHILGLLSDAGVQCHVEIINALIKAGLQWHIKKIVIHAILDGRDVAPQSAASYLQTLQEFIKPYPNIVLGSISGRYYAMDRDNHWDRTQKAFDNLVNENMPEFSSWQEALSYFYGKSITDEFIPPTLLQANTKIKNNDGVIFANFREDRARQLAACFIKPATTKLRINPPSLAFFITSIRYESDFINPVLLEIKPVPQTLKEILSKEGKTIFSIAETEKYAHVTYFFGGGHEKPFHGEQHVLIPSLPLKNYIKHPEMSAQKITDSVINSLQNNPCDFYLINYANADMVGHSGNLPATIKAIECLDQQLAQLYKQIVENMNGTLIITADHGNAELKFDEKTGQPYTAHTSNKVPFIWVKNELRDKKINLSLVGLADIAAFILRQY